MRSSIIKYCFSVGKDVARQQKNTNVGLFHEAKGCSRTVLRIAAKASGKSKIKTVWNNVGDSKNRTEQIRRKEHFIRQERKEKVL